MMSGMKIRIHLKMVQQKTMQDNKMQDVKLISISIVFGKVFNRLKNLKT